MKSGIAALDLAVAAGLMTAGSAAWGQALSDPTRPPAEWIAAQAKKTDGSRETGAGVPTLPAGVPPAGVAEGEVKPQLQSLLIGPSSRKFAIINGQLIAVGAAYRDAKLIDVRPGEAVLLSEHGQQTLKLFQDVEKTQAKAVGGEPRGASAKVKRRVDRRNVGAGKEVK